MNGKNKYHLTESDLQWVEETWKKLDHKLYRRAVSSYDKIPYTTYEGKDDDKKDVYIYQWTNGFWPGLMALMYSGTGKEQYLKTAMHIDDLMDKALFEFSGLHHDVGFMWNISSGAVYRLTGDLKERNRFMNAASHLMGRYNEKGRFIRAWNRENTEGWAIIDCMMNIPLLYRATEETGDERFKMVAMSHADTTLQYHLRADGSSNHIVEYDAKNGEGFITNHTGQGYSEYQMSSWSRGQSWALYGFALSYAHTEKPEYLDAAKKVAHYFIANTAHTDWIPLCDFRAPKEPVYYDTTAGAIAACGLLTIAEHVDEFEKDLYLKSALKLLHAMDEKYCDWTEEEDSILQMGMESYRVGAQLPLIYGDFFFTEAIYKLKGFENVSW